MRKIPKNRRKWTNTTACWRTINFHHSNSHTPRCSPVARSQEEKSWEESWRSLQRNNVFSEKIGLVKEKMKNLNWTKCIRGFGRQFETRLKLKDKVRILIEFRLGVTRVMLLKYRLNLFSFRTGSVEPSDIEQRNVRLVGQSSPAESSNDLLNLSMNIPVERLSHVHLGTCLEIFMKPRSPSSVWGSEMGEEWKAHKKILPNVDVFFMALIMEGILSNKISNLLLFIWVLSERKSRKHDEYHCCLEVSICGNTE